MPERMTPDPPFQTITWVRETLQKRGFERQPLAPLPLHPGLGGDLNIF